MARTGVGAWRGVGLAAVLLLVGLSLAGCTATFRNHGYVPTDAEMRDISVGIDNRDSVEGSIGKPGASGVLRDGDWYYVGSRVRHYAWKEPREIERQVVAISFSRSGTVTNIERFGLEDGRVVALSRRVTESNIKGISFISQLLKNFGRINLGDALSR